MHFAEKSAFRSSLHQITAHAGNRVVTVLCLPCMSCMFAAALVFCCTLLESDLGLRKNKQAAGFAAVIVTVDDADTIVM